MAFKACDKCPFAMECEERGICAEQEGKGFTRPPEKEDDQRSS